MTVYLNPIEKSWSYVFAMVFLYYTHDLPASISLSLSNLGAIHLYIRYRHTQPETRIHAHIYKQLYKTIILFCTHEEQDAAETAVYKVDYVSLFTLKLRAVECYTRVEIS